MIHKFTTQEKKIKKIKVFLLETPKEKDKGNKREVHEGDGRARDPDTMVVPPTPKSTRKTESLTRSPSKNEESTHLTYTGLVVELEHLKTKRLCIMNQQRRG